MLRSVLPSLLIELVWCSCLNVSGFGTRLLVLLGLCVKLKKLLMLFFLEDNQGNIV